MGSSCAVRTIRRLAAALLLLLVAATFISHYYLKHRSERYVRALQAKGEKMRYRDFVQPINPAKMDQGHALEAAISVIPWQSFLETNNPPLMIPTTGRTAIAASTLDPLPSPSPCCTNLWPGMAEFLETYSDQMQALRASCRDPEPAFSCDVSLGPNAPLFFLQQLRRSSRMLRAAALLDLHTGNLESALENMEALGALSSNASESFVRCQKAHLTISEAAAALTWEALHHQGWTDQQLERLQRTWAQMHWLQQVEAVLGTERLSALEVVSETRKSRHINVSAQQSLGSAVSEFGYELYDRPGDTLKEVFVDLPRFVYWSSCSSYADEVEIMKVYQAAIEAARQLRPGGAFAPVLNKLEQEFQTRAETPHRSNFGHYAAIGSITILQAIETAEIRRSISVTAIALERYKIAEGDYPAQLAALVPRYLPSIPVDPVDGAPLRYRKTGQDEFLLYSIGLDGFDNNGASAGASEFSMYGTVAARWKDRDTVWPAMANAEQAERWVKSTTAIAVGQIVNSKDQETLMAKFRARYGLKPR